MEAPSSSEALRGPGAAASPPAAVSAASVEAASAEVAAVSAEAGHPATGRAIDMTNGKAMKDTVRKFLSAAERLAIEKKVREMESSTSGEIVVMAVGASSHYPSGALTGGGAIALSLSLLVTQLFHSESIWLFLSCFAPLFIAAHAAVFRIPLLKRLFLSRREMAEEVEEAAIASFYRRKVHETRDRTGILIYISLFEHTVRVLADSGIDAKVGRDAWGGIVAMITDGIRDGCQGEAILSAVERCGAMLSAHFPRTPDNRNELPDVMIVGDFRD